MRSIQHHKPKLRVGDRQRGAVILVVTFSLIAFLALLALALDIGQMYIIKGQLQNAADAGALRGAKELNGTGPGVDTAREQAKEAAADGNGFLLVGDRLAHNQVVVDVAEQPSGPWVPASGITQPNNYFYIRVQTSASTSANRLATFFAGILGSDKAARALAIAGRLPEGRMLPLFVPIVRRNGLIEFSGGTWQRSSSWSSCPSGNLSCQQTASPAECLGEIFDPNDSQHGFKKFGCPNHVTPQDPEYIFRGPDPSGDWGFLRPGQAFAAKYLTATGSALPAGYDNNINDIGSHYVIKPEANAKDLELWEVAAAWSGNFGWTLSDPPSTQQKTILEAICRGSVKQAYPVTGCGDLHPGGLSDPQFTDVINTRFNVYPANDASVTPALCPSDKVITEYVNPPPSGYDIYKIEPGTVSTGASGRRVIRVYVVDNAWLNGFDEGKSLTCRPPLTGASRPAHIVGCAEFFIFKKSNKSDGLLFAEFVRRVPDNECVLGSGATTFNEIRLFR